MPDQRVIDSGVRIGCTFGYRLTLPLKETLSGCSCRFTSDESNKGSGADLTSGATEKLLVEIQMLVKQYKYIVLHQSCVEKLSVK